jgi:integrase
MASVYKRGGKSNRDGYWYVSWVEYSAKGQVRRSKCARTTDKATAERIARKLEAEAALRREGVIDPTLDAISKESQRTIDSHLADYQSKMKAAQCTELHVSRTAEFIEKISGWAGFKVAADITAEGVTRFAAKLRDEGRSARTIQSYLTGIKGFTKWLTETVKLPRDPLASVKKPNPRTDRRHERRMLLPEEWKWVEKSVKEGETKLGIPAIDRLLLYCTAIQTGLRANELRSLTRGKIFGEQNPPYILCAPKNTKNGDMARQYIRPELAAELKVHTSRKAPNAPVFDLPHETNMASMLRVDLAEARKRWIHEALNDPTEYAKRVESDFLAEANHEGKVIDFHALRHTCGAWLAMKGVHVKVVQQVMRHSAITLTMDTYGHLFPGQEAEAIGKMKEFFSEPTPVLKATGTDAGLVNIPHSAVQRRMQQTGRDLSPGNAMSNDESKSGNIQKALRIAMIRDDSRQEGTRRVGMKTPTHNPLVAGSNPAGPNENPAEKRSLFPIVYTECS